MPHDHDRPPAAPAASAAPDAAPSHGTFTAPSTFAAPTAEKPPVGGEVNQKGVSPLVQAELADAVEDAAVALAGIADALAARAAAEPDDLLELLADAADERARALRSLGAPWGAGTAERGLKDGSPCTLG